jgi:hypothetical protein
MCARKKRSRIGLTEDHGSSEQQQGRLNLERDRALAVLIAPFPHSPETSRCPRLRNAPRHEPSFLHETKCEQGGADSETAMLILDPLMATGLAALVTAISTLVWSVRRRR